MEQSKVRQVTALCQQGEIYILSRSAIHKFGWFTRSIIPRQLSDHNRRLAHSYTHRFNHRARQPIFECGNNLFSGLYDPV